jgi:hypothetical protein
MDTFIQPLDASSKHKRAVLPAVQCAMLPCTCEMASVLPVAVMLIG